MQFLKNLGTAGVGASKASGATEKTKYFSSLKL